MKREIGRRGDNGGRIGKRGKTTTELRRQPSKRKDRRMKGYVDQMTNLVYRSHEKSG